jgi:hypothetical protein
MLEKVPRFTWSKKIFDSTGFMAQSEVNPGKQVDYYSGSCRIASMDTG